MEGNVSWAKFQRILTNGNMVPDETHQEGWNWEECQALNVDICTALHSTDMESELKGKLRVLHRVEELHGKHPEVAAFDRLHELETGVIETLAGQGAGKDEEQWRDGMGFVKRLVEGLQMAYYETVGVTEPVIRSKALLQVCTLTQVSRFWNCLYSGLWLCPLGLRLMCAS